jgi:hypothetical protein
MTPQSNFKQRIGLDLGQNNRIDDGLAVGSCRYHFTSDVKRRMTAARERLEGAGFQGHYMTAFGTVDDMVKARDNFGALMDVRKLAIATHA